MGVHLNLACTRRQDGIEPKAAMSKCLHVPGVQYDTGSLRQQQLQSLDSCLPSRLGRAHLKHLNIKHSSKGCSDIASYYQIQLLAWYTHSKAGRPCHDRVVTERL